MTPTISLNVEDEGEHGFFPFLAVFSLAVNKDVRVFSNVFRNLMQAWESFQLLEENFVGVDETGKIGRAHV